MDSFETINSISLSQTNRLGKVYNCYDQLFSYRNFLFGFSRQSTAQFWDLSSVLNPVLLNVRYDEKVKKKAPPAKPKPSKYGFSMFSKVKKLGSVFMNLMPAVTSTSSGKNIGPAGKSINSVLGSNMGITATRDYPRLGEVCFDLKLQKGEKFINLSFFWDSAKNVAYGLTEFRDTDQDQPEPPKDKSNFPLKLSILPFFQRVILRSKQLLSTPSLPVLVYRGEFSSIKVGSSDFGLVQEKAELPSLSFLKAFKTLKTTKRGVNGSGLGHTLSTFMLGISKYNSQVYSLVFHSEEVDSVDKAQLDVTILRIKQGGHLLCQFFQAEQIDSKKIVFFGRSRVILAWINPENENEISFKELMRFSNSIIDVK